MNKESSEEESEESRYLSYLAHDNFETLDSQIFSVAEVKNFLASTDHRQRLYALNMLTIAVEKG